MLTLQGIVSRSLKTMTNDNIEYLFDLFPIILQKLSTKVANFDRLLKIMKQLGTKIPFSRFLEAMTEVLSIGALHACIANNLTKN